MRHRLKGRKFSRPSAQREALLLNLAISLLEHEQITTTLPKAKDLRAYVEKIISLARKNSLHTRRLLLAQLRGHQPTVRKLLEVLGPRYENRHGGYSRVVKAGFRKGDNAPMAVIELLDRDLNAGQVQPEDSATKILADKKLSKGASEKNEASKPEAKKETQKKAVAKKTTSKKVDVTK